MYDNSIIAMPSVILGAIGEMFFGIPPWRGVNVACSVRVYYCDPFLYDFGPDRGCYCDY